MNIAPILVGALLLLPGGLIGEKLFGVSGAVTVGAIVLINFAAWYAFRKVWLAAKSNGTRQTNKMSRE
jgi:purine-cytosine permease-like protein